MSIDDEESFEHTLLVVREVSVYKIPPRSTSGGYKCGEWLQSDKIWSGRLRVVSLKEVCEIRLEDSNTGDLFAACHVHPGKRETSVEPATDSSRYFVLRIDDGGGKHAFIGLGFAERNEAFDFNVALSDHEKHVLRRDESSADDFTPSEARPALDLRLKEGETIRINVNTKPSSSMGKMTHGGEQTNIASTGRMKAPLAPPPGGGRLCSPLPPPPSDNRQLRSSSAANTYVSGTAALKVTPSKEATEKTAKHASDPFADIAELETSLPSSFSSGRTTDKGSHGGWAAF